MVEEEEDEKREGAGVGRGGWVGGGGRGRRTRKRRGEEQEADYLRKAAVQIPTGLVTNVSIPTLVATRPGPGFMKGLYLCWRDHKPFKSVNSPKERLMKGLFAVLALLIVPQVRGGGWVM